VDKQGNDAIGLLGLTSALQSHTFHNRNPLPHTMPLTHSSAWLLPEHISDVLPAQARQIEELRRSLLDLARSYGCELVIPPLLEYLDSLLSGTGQELNLQTFKLVDQLSGRTMGVRADTTPQVARLDAHLLNREGVTRLCYCGPVLHTRPVGLYSTREPLQFGAEIYGHAGLEADLEVIDLALDCLATAGVDSVTLDLGDSRILTSLVEPLRLSSETTHDLLIALSAKDNARLQQLTASWPLPQKSALLALPRLYGDISVLTEAQLILPHDGLVHKTLQDLHNLALHVQHIHPEVHITVDLADMGGYAYYSGARFAIFNHGSSNALLRGGRYDEVGAVFGRKRAAVGFSLDLKQLAEWIPPRTMKAVIQAPWSEDPLLRATVRSLRQRGETVVCMLPGHEHKGQEFACDRQLVWRDPHWDVVPL
jgi:ATP phosphoribosyltransferase regulatory subunit